MKFRLKAKLDDLNVSLKNVSIDTAQRMYTAIAQLANMTYNKAIELAQQRLRSTRLDYINALHMKEEGGVFVVYLDPSANRIEEDSPAWNMLPKLAQGPKSKMGKSGFRYTIIPLRKGGNESVKLNVATKHGDLAADLKSFVKDKEFTTVKSGVSPVTGKYTTVERMTNKDVPAHVRNLVRIREYKQQGDKRPISSAMMTFRTASEKQDPNKHWRYPARKGAGIFKDLDHWVDQQMDIILKQFF